MKYVLSWSWGNKDYKRHAYSLINQRKFVLNLLQSAGVLEPNSSGSTYKVTWDNIQDLYRLTPLKTNLQLCKSIKANLSFKVFYYQMKLDTHEGLKDTALISLNLLVYYFSSQNLQLNFNIPFVRKLIASGYT